MSIEAISSAATVAILCTFVFVLAAKSWHVLSRAVAAHPRFPDSTMREAAQRFRDELDRLTSKQTTYVSAGTVFVVIFAVAYTLRASELFAGYPRWQLNLLMVVLVLSAVFAFYQVIRNLLEWRNIKLVRDANIAIGHQLQRLGSQSGRVYHDVATTAGIVDHVLISHQGIYAINVVAKAAKRGGAVSLADNVLSFTPGDQESSIVQINTKTRRLKKELGKYVGHPVGVRSVVAVPGWGISDQLAEEHLLVNERTLPMLLGWKDKADYLMNDDMNLLQDKLTVRGKRSVNLGSQV